jgi:hypothetical protein
VADIDLIPAAYLKRRLVERQVRRFLIVAIVMAALVGGARVALNRALASETATVARLQRAVEIYSQTEARADGFRLQRKIAETRLTQLDELRGRDRLKVLLQAVDTAYSPSIWLDELRYLRRENAPAAATPVTAAGSTLLVIPKDNPAAAANRRNFEQRVEIVGHAIDHTRLADFMRTLSSQPGIADVRLLDTGLRSYTNTQVIDLSLTLLIEDRPGVPQ